jgi:hypothetical protein
MAWCDGPLKPSGSWRVGLVAGGWDAHVVNEPDRTWSSGTPDAATAAYFGVAGDAVRLGRCAGNKPIHTSLDLDILALAVEAPVR